MYLGVVLRSLCLADLGKRSPLTMSGLFGHLKESDAALCKALRKLQEAHQATSDPGEREQLEAASNNTRTALAHVRGMLRRLKHDEAIRKEYAEKCRCFAAEFARQKVARTEEFELQRRQAEAEFERRLKQLKAKMDKEIAAESDYDDESSDPGDPDSVW